MSKTKMSNAKMSKQKRLSTKLSNCKNVVSVKCLIAKKSNLLIPCYTDMSFPDTKSPPLLNLTRLFGNFNAGSW